MDQSICSFTGANTFFGKTATLIAAASGEKSNMEKVHISLAIVFWSVFSVHSLPSLNWMLNLKG